MSRTTARVILAIAATAIGVSCIFSMTMQIVVACLLGALGGLVVGIVLIAGLAEIIHRAFPNLNR